MPLLDIIQGDCRSAMPQQRARFGSNLIVVTDPPFNIGYHYSGYSDRLKNAEYYQMLTDVLGPHVCVVVHYPESLYRLSACLKRIPERVVSWVYNSNTARQHRDIAFFGVCPNFRKYGQPYKNPTDKRVARLIREGRSARLYDWWEINQVKNVSVEKTEHPCQMPVEVMLRAVGVLPDGAVIVDPFMGSGTTGVACKILGRDFVGIELEGSYCEIARQRIASATPRGDTGNPQNEESENAGQNQVPPSPVEGNAGPRQ